MERTLHSFHSLDHHVPFSLVAIWKILLQDVTTDGTASWWWSGRCLVAVGTQTSNNFKCNNNKNGGLKGWMVNFNPDMAHCTWPWTSSTGSGMVFKNLGTEFYVEKTRKHMNNVSTPWLGWWLQASSIQPMNLGDPKYLHQHVSNHIQ